MEDASKSPKTSKVAGAIAPPTELPSFLKKTKAVSFSEKTDEIEVQTTTKDSEKSVEKNIEEKEEKQKQAQDVHEDQSIAAALTPITEGVKNTVLYSWMKDSFKNSMEIAKDSVHKVVTTLDPQMGQILNSGGDMEVIVASTNEDKIDSVREAFQDVFRKATVYGKKGGSECTIAIQPVGFEAAELSAKERINQLRSVETLVDKTILSVENFLVELYKNQWFDVGLLLLSDIRNNLTLKTFTQFTPVPLEIVKSLESETPASYEKRQTGYAVTIGGAMAKHLNVPHYEWHYKYTGLHRYEMIVHAAKSLASIYKRELHSKSSAPTEEK